MSSEQNPQSVAILGNTLNNRQPFAQLKASFSPI